MRYMRWSYQQLMACPEDYVAVIAEDSRRVAAERERATRR
jgi:hypothetical protein